VKEDRVLEAVSVEPWKKPYKLIRKAQERMGDEKLGDPVKQKPSTSEDGKNL